MASKSNGLDAAEWARAPPSGPLWQRMLKAIYNHEEKSFLGRTAKRWGIAITFYLVFYAVLALLLAICLGGLFLTIDDHRPTYTLDKSLIGANPGVAFRPLPSDDDGLVITLDQKNSSRHEFYAGQLDEFFTPYEALPWISKQTVCVSKDNYGYPNAACFFIKLNKIFDWQPQFYDAGSLPADMPEDLVRHIQNLDPTKRQQVWISCFEEKKNTTKIDYPWGMGLPSGFFPYTNDKGYLSPLVAVRLVPLANTLTIVRCRAWAKNIVYNKSLKEPSGYTRIQLYIEGSASSNTTGTTE